MRCTGGSAPRRRAHPVVMWGGVRAWLVTRYAEARALLNDPRLGKGPGTCVDAVSVRAPRGPHASSLNVNMLLRDPPDHTRLRRLVSKAFTAGAVERLRPRIERITEELLDGIEARAAEGAVDLMEFFGAPLPMGVIGELLGVAWADREKFRTAVDPVLTTTDPDELRTAMGTLTTLLSALIAGKREGPADDLLTALVQVSDSGDRLSEDELLATAYLLILGGSTRPR